MVVVPDRRRSGGSSQGPPVRRQAIGIDTFDRSKRVHRVRSGSFPRVLSRFDGGHRRKREAGGGKKRREEEKGGGGGRERKESELRVHAREWVYTTKGRGRGRGRKGEN